MEKPYTLTAPESVPPSFHEISHDLENFRKEFPAVVKITIACQGCWCDKGDFIEIVPGKPFKCVHNATQPVRVAFDSSTNNWELIGKCPLLKSGVPFQLCKDKIMNQPCKLRPRCTFAHSEIEKSVWELERTSKYLLVPWTKSHLSSFKCGFLNIFCAKTCWVNCNAYCFCYGGTKMARKNIWKTTFQSTFEMIQL